MSGRSGDDPSRADGQPTVAVAYSGGRDSTALLHACARVATPLGVRTLAIHVHHGLQPQADDWLAHARRTCRRWATSGLDLVFEAVRLDTSPPAGASVEAWAREARYAALTRVAHQHGATLVLLAHHAQDQAETVLLQMLRRGGPSAWAAMPRQARRGGLVWARPWLGQPPQALAHYARAHRLGWVEDPSNLDPRHDRSRLRQQVWPALEAAFPGAVAALGQVAVAAQEARDAQDCLARRDLAACQKAPDEALRLDAWLTLPPASSRGVLALWLGERLGRVPPGALVDRLMVELPVGRGPALWPTTGGAVLRRYRGQLRLRPAPPDDTGPAPDRAGLLRVSAPGRYPCAGWGGAWRVTPVATGGVPAGDHCWTLRPRAGAEQFQQGPGRPPRSLKKQFQARGLPAWEREGPLVWEGERLVAVPGLGVDARHWAPPGNEQWQLSWEADPST